MVNTAGAIVIAIVVLLVIAATAWVVFTQLRARKLGLPPPSLSSYLPWRQRDNPFGPPRPAPGGVAGWFSDQMRKFKSRNKRSAGGAYEQPLHGGTGRGRHGFGALDPDEAWDARVGHEADGYGYYEEQELSGTGRGRSTEYAGSGGYNSNLAATPAANYDGEARGRPPTRSPGGQRNPFDDDAEIGLRGMSPRPIDTTVAQKHKPKDDPDSGGSSPAERRSVFRENV
ncbi:hypothetical protein G6O67_000341 [Ophiocordyceps sinensis]|uniref:Acid phosphatase-like protein n=2 Tax=Ophiocordyceps sinensis TaxID=72228 RepID=A0A8H4V9M0_9HYPO|nr:hypothetical protein OCS_05559 [Ophiocordyceps sinensis CO18]KAF4513018.1 hypothetical protein G6O67_000341 [Ophiocordyceps sinensis]